MKCHAQLGESRAYPQNCFYKLKQNESICCILRGKAMNKLIIQGSFVILKFHAFWGLIFRSLLIPNLMKIHSFELNFNATEDSLEHIYLVMSTKVLISHFCQKNLTQSSCLICHFSQYSTHSFPCDVELKFGCTTSESMWPIRTRFQSLPCPYHVSRFSYFRKKN